ncbi:MAG: hypothetical protein KIT16_16290 [Rhodospirillaceae bacterium]|nr:hypothetical protein [Rhodospirillaceae bacterium]
MPRGTGGTGPAADLIELTELSAELVLKKRGDGLIELSGHRHARSAPAERRFLEPVRATHDEEIRQSGGGLARDLADFDPLDEEGWLRTPIENGGRSRRGGGAVACHC